LLPKSAHDTLVVHVWDVTEFCHSISCDLSIYPDIPLC